MMEKMRMDSDALLSPQQSEREPELITDPEDAREYIHELLEKGERPIVSVPQEYADALAKGLVAHATWIPDFSAVVGTLGRNPYTPTGEERVLLKIEIDNERQLEPRFTGPSHSYQGVVMFRGPIPAEKITRLN